jgi:hypothetical protein
MYIGALLMPAYSATHSMHEHTNKAKPTRHQVKIELYHKKSMRREKLDSRGKARIKF